jgi:hypothetical protein
MGSAVIAEEWLLRIYILIALVLVIVAPAAAWQLVQTGAIVGKEVASTAIEVGEVLEDTCGEVSSGLRESLDPIFHEFEQPLDTLTATALELRSNRLCHDRLRR